MDFRRQPRAATEVLEMAVEGDRHGTGPQDCAAGKMPLSQGVQQVPTMAFQHGLEAVMVGVGDRHPCGRRHRVGLASASAADTGEGSAG